MIANRTIQHSVLDPKTTISPISLIIELFQKDYGHHSEITGMLDQALETACRAAEVNATPRMVTAALLHDVSHLLFVNDVNRFATRTCRATTLDSLHSSGTLQWLNQSFGHEVSDPFDFKPTPFDSCVQRFLDTKLDCR